MSVFALQSPVAVMKCSALHVEHDSPFRHVEHDSPHSAHVRSLWKFPALQTAHPPAAEGTSQVPTRSAFVLHTLFDRNIPLRGVARNAEGRTHRAVTQFPSHAEYVPRHPQADAPHLRFATNQVALNAPPRLGGKEHLILAPLERPVDMLNTLTLPDARQRVERDAPRLARDAPRPVGLCARRCV